MQAIFWYGRSQDYQDDQEIEFYKYVPTVWDESHYLAGEIGESISVARRKSDTWYLGNASGLKPYHAQIKLDFLKKGQDYQATVYKDDGRGGIRIRTLTVNHGDDFPIQIAAKGGQAIIIRQVK